MNYWTDLSINYANQKNYLDDLFSVYPTIPEGIRDVDSNNWEKIEKCFKERNNTELIKNLLVLDLFPIKDSYVAYLKKDKSAIERNPKTIDRLCGRVYEIGLKDLFLRCSEPKETNRQIGPLFKRWLNKKSLGINPLPLEEFKRAKSNAVLDAGDKEMANFAKKELNYQRNKGLDFIGKFNNKYVIGEAKFLTDFGGHQNAQFNDAISTVKLRNVKAEIVAILDGVLYIKGDNKMHKELKKLKNYTILSSLLLRDFLYQI